VSAVYRVRCRVAVQSEKEWSKIQYSLVQNCTVCSLTRTSLVLMFLFYRRRSVVIIYPCNRQIGGCARVYECFACATLYSRSVLTVATLVARNANEAVVLSGGGCVWRESGVRLSFLCWCDWQEFGFSRVIVFQHLIYFTYKHKEIL
jgi:hypothetical protein